MEMTPAATVPNKLRVKKSARKIWIAVKCAVTLALS